MILITNQWFDVDDARNNVMSPPSTALPCQCQSNNNCPQPQPADSSLWLPTEPRLPKMSEFVETLSNYVDFSQRSFKS